MTVVNFKMTRLYKKGYGYGRTQFGEKLMKYKVPKISNKTEKGKWLNGFVKKFFVAGNHNYRFTTAKNYIHLKTTHFNINNTKAALVGFFKNLKKLKQHHFENQVFSSYMVYEPVKEAA